MTSIGDIPKTLDDRAKGRGKARYFGTSPTVPWTFWSYLDQPSALPVQLVDCLARLTDTFSTPPVVPSHSEGNDRFTNHFPRVEALADPEWWEL